MLLIEGCDCGQVHRVSDTYLKASKTAQDYRRLVPVGNVYGCWWVPWTWLAFHSAHLARDLRRNASLFSWPEVEIRMPARTTGIALESDPGEAGKVAAVGRAPHHRPRATPRKRR